jgi:hypothetical protein
MSDSLAFNLSSLDKTLTLIKAFTLKNSDAKGIF